MQVSEIRHFISEPWKLKKEHLGELKSLAERFPYFHSVQLLLAYCAGKWDPAEYQNSIKKAAISIPNREQLYELLHLRETEISETVLSPAADEEKTVKPVITVAEEKALPELKEDSPVTKEEHGDVEEKTKVPAISKELSEKESIASEDTHEAKLNELVEKSMEKAIVESFVESEILKTQEAGKKPEIIPETADFTSWLAVLKSTGPELSEQKQKDASGKEEREHEQEPVQKDRKLKQKALIDKIIELNPGKIRPKEEQKFFRSEHNAKESLLENEHLITETLANIYASTGNIHKAIRAYEILSLKFPQKSVYFASLIQKLKNNSKND